MKTIKITEKAHQNLIEMQAFFYTIRGKKFTFSEIIEKFRAVIEDSTENDK